MSVASTAQSYDDVLFINAEAPAEHLREAALRRLTTVEDLLHLVENDTDRSLITLRRVGR